MPPGFEVLSGYTKIRESVGTVQSQITKEAGAARRGQLTLLLSYYRKKKKKKGEKFCHRGVARPRCTKGTLGGKRDPRTNLEGIRRDSQQNLDIDRFSSAETNYLASFFRDGIQ